jgi:hypothetical protein
VIAGLTSREVSIATLTEKKRHSLSGSNLAFPDKRKEPLNDARHVRNIARFDQVEGVAEPGLRPPLSLSIKEAIGATGGPFRFANTCAARSPVSNPSAADGAAARAIS